MTRTDSPSQEELKTRERSFYGANQRVYSCPLIDFATREYFEAITKSLSYQRTFRRGTANTSLTVPPICDCFLSQYNLQLSSEGWVTAPTTLSECCCRDYLLSTQANTQALPRANGSACFLTVSATFSLCRWRKLSSATAAENMARSGIPGTSSCGML